MKRSTAKKLINGAFAIALLGIGYVVGEAINSYEPATTIECPHCTEAITILSDNSVYIPPETETIVVGYGETLWNICRDYCPDDMNIRDYIEKIKSYNNINSNVYCGQEIKMLIIE